MLDAGRADVHNLVCNVVTAVQNVKISRKPRRAVLAPAAKRSRGGTASGGAQTAKSMQACVGAGLKCPPEQRRERKELLSVMKSKFYFRRNKLQYFTFCGRAQRPAPTTTGFIF